MALVIRLRQQGSRNRQTFRLVVTEKRNPRDGKYIEMLGWYNPLGSEGKQLKLDDERILFWVNNGAVLTKKAEDLVNQVSPEVAQNLKARKFAKRDKIREEHKKSRNRKKAGASEKVEKKAAPKKEAAPKKTVRKKATTKAAAKKAE